MDLTARSDLLTSAGANKECKEGFNTKEGQVKEGMFWKEPGGGHGEFSGS